MVNRLEGLGRSLMGRRYSPKALFTMFAAYFDESGGNDSRFTFVCGYTATVAQWSAFEFDWKLFLAKFRVPYLHMKEFSQSKKCYTQWQGNKTLRAQFLGMASEIIGSHLQRAFIGMVSHDGFDKVDLKYKLRERFNSPYALAGRACIALANNRARESSNGTLEIEYIFEDGCPDKGGLIKAVEALPPFLPAPSFKPSRDARPSKNWPGGRSGLVHLQAADYLAYEAGKLLRDLYLIRSGEREVRKSLKALTKVPVDRTSWGEARLVRTCEGANFGRRD